MHIRKILLTLIITVMLLATGIDNLRHAGAFASQIGEAHMGNEISVSSLDNEEYLPSVAYNWKHHEYLTVWHTKWSIGSRDIRAARISEQGQVIKTFIVYSHATKDSAQPSVAYDPVNDRYLVVWVFDYWGNGSDMDLYGRFLPWDGPGSSQNAFTICNLDTHQWNPKVAYGRTMEEFLVVWANEDQSGTNPMYISGQRINASDASFPGSALTISHATENRANPDVTYNLARNEYVVVYDNGLDIFGMRLSGNLANHFGGEFKIAGWPGTEIYPAVAACSGADQYLVVWQSDQDTNDDAIYGRFLNGEATLGSVHLIDNTTSPERNPDVACNMSGTLYFVTLQSRYTNLRYGIEGHMVKPDGTIGPAIDIVYPGSSADRTSPAVAGGSDNYMAIWEHSRDGTAYQDIHGRPVTLGIPASTGTVTVNHAWNTFNPTHTYTDPVVILGPPTYHGADPGTVRLRNVTGSSFDARFQEWPYKDGLHTQETLPYIFIASGRYQMVNDIIWEAGTFSLSGTGAWASQSFSTSFPSTPALFLTAQTFNGHDPITVKARNVTNTGFDAALFEEEAQMNGHTTETIGYLAVYNPLPSGTIWTSSTKFPYILQTVPADHRFTPVLSSTIKLEEEQSKDSEVNHTDETSAILALGDKIFAQIVSNNGADTVAMRRLAPEYGAVMEWGTVYGVDQNWIKVPLAKEYLHPVVAARPVSYRGGDPGVIRIRNVSYNSFELRYNEWAYKDGFHTQERVFYLVAEEGIRSVSGLTVEARRLNSSKLLADGWETVNFSASFSHAPCIFTSVQTCNGADPVTTRLDNLTSAGFDLTMNEEEARNDGHTTETLGWIAIERGTGKTNDNRSVVVLKSSTGSTPHQINFGQSMDRRFPVVVSDMITTNGSDPGFLRYQNLGPGSIDLFIQEETSADPEMIHTMEDVSLFIAE